MTKLHRDDVLVYIAMYTEANHSSPSGKQIARTFGRSVQTIHYHLKRLIDEGRLVRVDRGWKIPGAVYIPPVLTIITKPDI